MRSDDDTAELAAHLRDEGLLRCDWTDFPEMRCSPELCHVAFVRDHCWYLVDCQAYWQEVDSHE